MKLELNKKYLNKKGDVVKIVSNLQQFYTDENDYVYKENGECISNLMIKNKENVLDILREFK